MQTQRYLCTEHKNTYRMIKQGNPNELAKVVARRLFGKKKSNQQTQLAQHVEPKRTERLSVRLTADEKAQLKDFSEQTGISYTKVVSICLNALKKG